MISNDDKIDKIPEKQIEDKTKKESEWEKTGEIDYKKDFFGKKANLTVSG